MADELPPYVGNGEAPFVYFDYVPTFGVQSGAIQIELAARTILPAGNGKTAEETVCTGHLRFSPAAALALQQALTNVLAMWETTQEPPAGAIN